jgi:hypothetical protein
MQTISLDKIELGERIRATDEKYCVELARSIRDEGLLHPIVLRKEDNRLISGGHRFHAHKLLACGEVENEDQTFYESIPFVYFEEYLIESGKIKEGETISESQLRKLEIEENIRRKDMTWWERLFGVVSYHKTCGAEARSTGDEWTQAMTGELLGLNQAFVSIALDITKMMKSGEHQEMFELPSLSSAIQYKSTIYLKLAVKQQELRAAKKREELFAASKAKNTLITVDKVAFIEPDGQMELAEERETYNRKFVEDMYVEELAECELLITHPFHRVSEEQTAPLLEMSNWKWAVVWCYITDYSDIWQDLKESTQGWQPLPNAFHWVDNSAGTNSPVMMPNKVHTAIVLRSDPEAGFRQQTDRNFYESVTPTGMLRYLMNLLTGPGHSILDPTPDQHWVATAAAQENRIPFMLGPPDDSVTDKIHTTLNSNIKMVSHAKSPFSSLLGLD